MKDPIISAIIRMGSGGSGRSKAASVKETEIDFEAPDEGTAQVIRKMCQNQNNNNNKSLAASSASVSRVKEIINFINRAH